MPTATLSQIRRHVSGRATSKAVVISLLVVTILCVARPCFGQQSDSITYAYDGLNRLVKVVYADGTTITYTYDAAGNRTSMQVTAPAALALGGVSPRTGRASGGQQIRLSGSFAGLSAVVVGGTSAAWSYSNGTGEIILTTPPHAVGVVAIELTSSAGTTLRKENAFAYLPTTFTDDPLVAGVTEAKAQHVLELRAAVDALRAVAGLAAAPWSDATLPPRSAVIKVVHIDELRRYLEEAAARLGHAAAVYTDPSLSAGSFVRRIHVEELRHRVRTLAG